jgi:short-subunit dehydrogenase
VASMVGRVELAGLATYSASKHALVGLTSAVRAELHGTGVTLTTVLPGVVDTELSSGFAIPLTRLLRVGPQDVAEAIVASVHDRPHELAVPGWMGLVPYLRPWVPAPLETLVRRLLGGDSAMRPAGSARAAYTERLERQAAGD